jgi:hypothetical protein
MITEILLFALCVILVVWCILTFIRIFQETRRDINYSKMKLLESEVRLLEEQKHLLGYQIAELENNQDIDELHHLAVLKLSSVPANLN